MAECNDKNCHIHGTLSVRGASIVGKVVSAKAKYTAVVERPMIMKITKYKRYARRRSKVQAHCPECMDVKVGDTVRIRECRKISRTKAWTVTEVLKKGEEE